MAKKKSPVLVESVRNLLLGEGAHPSFDDAVDRFPAGLRGRIPRGSPHSAWQLLEHIRIAQWDIVRFSESRDHESPPWPEGYWPEGAAPPSASAWRKSIEMVRADREEMLRMVAAPETDLFARIPWGTGQTLLREALLIADHTAYHVGQIVLVRTLLGAWPRGR